MKKFISIAAFALFAIALSYGIYYLMSKDCSACNTTDCLDNGSVSYRGQADYGYCYYDAWVSQVYGEGVPYVHWLDKSTLEEKSAMMQLHSIVDVCAWYHYNLHLAEGHSYEVWFTSSCSFNQNGGYEYGGQTGYVDCW
jgi:hypothetical protein